MVQLARQVGEQFASRAEQTERTFLMSLPDNPVRISGNEAQLRRILANLLDNALKFTPAGGQIHVRLEDDNNEASLNISDSGIGIPPEDQPHLFERFHRGRNVSEYPGNGLGLAIVKAIVTAHGGKLTIHSQPGHGTQVLISLRKP